MARRSFFYHLKCSQQEDKYKTQKNEIFKIFHENKGRYGHRRIYLELRNRGIVLSHKTVLKLMNSMKLKCEVRLKNIVHIKEMLEELPQIS